MRSDFVSVTDQISCFAPIDKPRSRLTIYCLFQSTNSDITTFKRYHHRRYTKLLDAILNVADDQDDSQGLHNQDSWVHQFRHSNNKTINFSEMTHG